LLEVDESLLSRRSNSAVRVANTWICPVSVSICTAWVLITSRSPRFAFCSAEFAARSAEINSASDDSSSPVIPQ